MSLFVATEPMVLKSTTVLLLRFINDIIIRTYVRCMAWMRLFYNTAIVKLNSR